MRPLVSLRACAGWLAGIVLACAAAGVRADTPIALFKSFAGNVNFVGTQKTMRTAANGANACSVAADTTVLTATLSGIPAGATILNAQLYWAGSGSTNDYTVSFEGAAVTATRQYQSNTVGYAYFGGAIDVTTQVTAKRNGDYTFSGLTINNGSPYCAVEGVLGGFSLLVIYSDAAESFRVLNLYEGFQYIQYNGITLNLSNFKIPTPLGTATGRIGHVTWEGDATLGANGEDLLFNGIEMTDTLNPAQNQFNSKSNINNDSASYGIDFDAYTVGSTVIAAGQTSASTRYQSGQDLVLLNAEIIAVPNVPVADLGITMQRTGTLVAQANTSYTLTVTNSGPNPDGPITVTDTLPAGLTFVSASGSGWACSAAGQVVTCTAAGVFAANATLPAITLTATVTGGGTITNSAAVGGQLFDNVASNNTASDTGTVSSPPYVLTNAPCLVGQSMASASQTCKLFGLTPLTAGTPANAYVTILNNGLVIQPAQTTVSMSFALKCVNPTTGAGVSATLGPLTLPVCASNTTPTNFSSATTVTFTTASTASAALAFNYNDVGQLSLYLRDPNSNVIAGTPFVSKPASFALTQIKQGATTNAPTNDTGPVFVKAGTAFSMTVSSLTSGGLVTPNFGRETTPEAFGLANPAAVAAFPVANLPPILGAFPAASGGTATGTGFSWENVGIISVAPTLVSSSYLGAGAVAGTPSNIGRFIPDHFDTTATGPMACLSAAGTNMGCPPSISTAAYSAQPFSVTVVARSSTNVQLSNFTYPVSGPNYYARAVTLSAYNQPGGAVLNPPTGSSVLASSAVPATAFSGGMATVLAPTYTLPNPYLYTAPNALGWTAPTSIFLRADASEPNGSASAIAVTSNRGPTLSQEGGVKIVSGRLLVVNAYGSERLKLPVPLEAQYWSSAGRWETSSNDAQALPPASAVIYSGCVFTPVNSPCLALQVGPASLALAGGRNQLVLVAPGNGRSGSAYLRITGAAWLPSTLGRLVFGISTSPLIYIREVY